MTKINPTSRVFVVLDNNDVCIGKHDTAAPVEIPVDDYNIVELDSRAELDNYNYDAPKGYQTPYR